MLRAALALIASAFVAQAAAEPRVAIGVLECRMSRDRTAIIIGTRNLDCRFDTLAGVEQYDGYLTIYGADLSVDVVGAWVWAVSAATTKPAGAMAGKYYGGTAEVSLGIGGGVNVLVGAGDSGISLQPLSFTALHSWNAAIGFAELELTRKQ